MNKLKILVMVVCFAMLCMSCTTIDSGSVGVRFKKWAANEAEQGGVIGTCKGFVWYNPFTQNIYEYPVYVQRKSYETVYGSKGEIVKDDAISVNSKDASIFKISPTIAYRLDPDKVTYIFVKYRKKVEDLEEGYIRTCIYEAYRTCGNKYTADHLMSNREEFENEVRLRLEKSLGTEGFIVDEFTAKIDPPQSLKNSIDAKNEAVQNALKAENQVKEAEAKAKIDVAKAQGEANALRIKADGEAYYNRTVAASITPLLIQQYSIEKWDGKLPVTSAGGAVPFLNIK